jgi:diaminopimelate epimerase
VKFAKAHGLGNDFILVAETDVPPDVSPWVQRLCDRHRGIGGDGVIVYARGTSGPVMKLYNSDGLDGEISGNGLRCLAALAVRAGWAEPEHVVQTAVGPRRVSVSATGATSSVIETDLGVPRLGSRDVPFLLEPPRDRVVDLPLEVAGRTVPVTATSMGNPHCAVFLDTPAEDALVATLGPALEHHPLFPHRTNVEFVTAVSREEIRVRFWERGVGPTEASGTGSASAVVASILTGRTGRDVRVVCDGGVLEVSWPEGGSVRQTGSVEILFEGDWLS